jgi:hypothetical protein
MEDGAVSTPEANDPAHNPAPTNDPAHESDPARESAQPQSTQLAALGALTTELIAARRTLENLPTRGEVESRLAEERSDRRRAFRWLAAAVGLLLLGSGLGIWERADIHNITRDIRQTTEETNRNSQSSQRVLETLQCAIRAVGTLPPDQVPAAFSACVD